MVKTMSVWIFILISYVVFYFLFLTNVGLKLTLIFLTEENLKSKTFE